MVFCYVFKSFQNPCETFKWFINLSNQKQTARNTFPLKDSRSFLLNCFEDQNVKNSFLL